VSDDNLYDNNAKPRELLIQVGFVKSSFEGPKYVECEVVLTIQSYKKKDLLVNSDCRAPRRVSPSFEQ